MIFHILYISFVLDSDEEPGFYSLTSLFSLLICFVIWTDEITRVASDPRICRGELPDQVKGVPHLASNCSHSQLSQSSVSIFNPSKLFVVVELN